jgi:CRP/FNR family cyclic AMP-dependent transcriptional regulator
MTTSTKTLSSLPFFSGLGEDALRDISFHISERNFNSGQVITMEDMPCTGVYFVTRGLVRSGRMSFDGREHVIAYLGPGKPFNLVAALDGGTSTMKVESVTDATLCSISCDRFRMIMREHHEVALAVSAHLAAEVRRLGEMVEELALHTVRTRLARFLLAHADGTPVTERQWTQEEIAAQIGTVREMVGRTLRSFGAQGLIRRRRGSVTIVDREGLAREGAMG